MYYLSTTNIRLSYNTIYFWRMYSYLFMRKTIALIILYLTTVRFFFETFMKICTKQYSQNFRKSYFIFQTLKQGTYSLIMKPINGECKR